MNLLTPNVIWTLSSLLTALVIGSMIRLIALRRADSETRRKRLGSLASWWVLALLITGAITIGSYGVCILMAIASWLALREYTRLVMPDPAERTSRLVMFALVPVYYAWIAWAQPAVLPAWIPIIGFLSLSATVVLQGRTENYVRRTACLVWGSLLLIVALSHVALLTTLPESANPVAGPLGWFLFIVILTESNDITQALVGRRFGRHKKHRLAPMLSPNKTWEGFIGGVTFTILLAVLLAPVLTPFHQLPESSAPVSIVDGTTGFLSTYSLTASLWSAAIGLMVGIVGLLGDLNMSGIKRDIGVKDSSNLFPGMGGMLDRIDSLTFTAPVFYWTVTWWTT